MNPPPHADPASDCTGTIPFRPVVPVGDCLPDSAFWQPLPELELRYFHPRSSDHHPRTRVKVCYDEAAIGILFRVEDRYVLSKHTALHSPVCRDSCVEFFVRPGGAAGYFNFEANCGGALHASYIRNPARTADGFANFEFLRPEDCATIRIAASRPGVTDPEMTEPLEWTLAMYVPFATLARYCGAAAEGREGWRGNFYKCADASSHPHWGCWQPVQKLNFHQPATFGHLLFQR